MPHWPNGSEADEAVDGKYIVDSDDLIIGFETKPVTMTIDEAREIYPNLRHEFGKWTPRESAGPEAR